MYIHCTYMHLMIYSVCMCISVYLCLCMSAFMCVSVSGDTHLIFISRHNNFLIDLHYSEISKQALLMCFMLVLTLYLETWPEV